MKIFLSIFHLVFALGSLWMTIETASMLDDDFLGFNLVTMWFSLGMAVISIIALVALYKKVTWALTYAKTLASIYLGLLSLSVMSYFASI